MRRQYRLVGWLIISILAVPGVFAPEPAGAAASWASPAFHKQWERGESLMPNFWGPLANATEGMREPYQEAYNQNRLVQYFDKGRMELNSPGAAVTNGLLAAELLSGRVQLGDNSFESRAPAAVSVAGDPGQRPTYADMAAIPRDLVDAASPVTSIFFSNGSFRALPVDAADLPPAARPGVIAANTKVAFDAPTGHHVIAAFATVRERLGLSTIGYALTEPVLANVRVGGAPRVVTLQVFERRVLSYTYDNPEPFRVEFGNIGQHYVHWRYPEGGTPVAGLGPFARDWGKHGFHLSLDRNGRGEAGWRTYSWCGDDPTPPCDSIVDNMIKGGGEATLQFSRVEGNTAFGLVTSSTDPATLEVGPAMLVLLPYGMAELRQGPIPITLCGPDFADLAPPELQAQSPCGA